MADENQSTIMSDGGGDTGAVQAQSLGWKTELPEAQRGHEAFAPYPTKSDLYKGHIDLYTKHNEAVQKLTDLEGKLTSYIPKLTEKATPEEKAAYRAAMDIPDKPEDYEVDLAEGQDATLANEFKKWAYDLNLPRNAVKEISTRFNTFIDAVLKDQTAQAEKAVRDLWGADFDKNAEIVKSIFKALEADGLNDFAQLQVVGGDGKPVAAGNHPVVLNAFLEIGKKTMPDSILRGAPQTKDVKIGLDYSKIDI